MGLDVVELMMRLEEEFEVEIKDEVAETLHTVQDVCECVWHLRAAQPFNGVLTSRDSLLEQVRAAIADELGAPLERVPLEADIVRDLGLQ